jgi:hypothetical protein
LNGCAAREQNLSLAKIILSLGNDLFEPGKI